MNKNVLLKKYRNIKNLKLVFAVLIDLVGISTYVLPGLGETGDLVWAPISALLIFILFPNHKMRALTGGIEELLPFTDFIPTAYLAWRKDYVKDKEKILYEFIRNNIEEEQITEEILQSLNIK